MDLDDRLGLLEGCHDWQGLVDALEEAVNAFNRQRGEAEKRLRDLVIHREAAGFRRNQALYDAHPIPARER